MKPAQIGQFKAVHKKIDKLMEDMKYDISTMGELYFVRRVKSISDDLGVLIERLDADARGEKP